jgi:hypothetical protein
MEIADASGFKVPETDKKRNDNDIYNGWKWQSCIYKR